MGYEPTILIKIESLEKHKDMFEEASHFLEDEDTRGGEDDKTHIEYLRDLYFEDDKFINDVFGIKCRSCTPSFSSYNKEIRNKLDELDIEYTLID